MTIEQRAEAKYSDNDPAWDIAKFERLAYISGATEERQLIAQQTASLEARVKELEQALKRAYALIEKL